MNDPNPGRARPRAGFTMLEALIAVSLVAVGLLGMTAGQLAAAKLSAGSRERTEASYIAQERIEAFHHMPAAAVIALGSGSDGSAIQTQAGSYNRSWTITQDSPEAGVITITVDVGWTDERGLARSVSLQTLKQDI